MKITLVHKLNDSNGPHGVLAPMQDFEEAKQVVIFLNQKAIELAKAGHGEDWEEYANYYFAREYDVLSTEDIITAIS